MNTRPMRPHGRWRQGDGRPESLLCLLATQPELRAGMADPACWLGAAEQARLATLSTEARQHSFLAGRWLARLAVQRWCDIDRLPTLEVADSGACHVVSEGEVFVSISHSGDHVACAVAELPVGVDVESPGRPRDYLALAQAVHCDAQQERLARLAPTSRARCFLQDWTLKEAWLKAREQQVDFALMRTLEFDNDPCGDSAVTHIGELILAVAANPALPPVIDGLPRANWRRCQSRRSAVA